MDNLTVLDIVADLRRWAEYLRKKGGQAFMPEACMLRALANAYENGDTMTLDWHDDDERTAN